MKKTIMLVFDKDMYFYGYEIKCVYPYKIRGVLLRIFLKLNLRIPLCFLHSEVLDAKRIIITDTIYSDSLYKTLVGLIGEDNVYLYCMNVIDKRIEKFLDRFSDRAYTFDLEDAQRYHLKFKHTPYSDQITIVNGRIEYDAIFLGKEKDRLDKIIEIDNILKDCGLKTKIMLLETSKEEYKVEHFMSYNEYLKLLEESRCILEIVSDGQAGCSLRFMEMLFLHKKLITNNLNVLKDEYYNPNNVFIVGRDNPEKLLDFIYDSYDDGGGKQLEKLKFKNWIETW